MIRVGALAPLSPPGLVAAGRELADGLRLAVADVNAGGGIDGEEIDLDLRDSGGGAHAGVAAVEEVHRAGVVAVVGEFHSVVAVRVAERAEELGLPFVCSSATIDALTARKARCVFRLAPPQSHGWRIYADFLAAHGYHDVLLAIESNVYSESGAAVLTQRLAEHGVAVRRADVGGDGRDVLETLGARPRGRSGAALLLLGGYPSPAREILHAARSDPRFASVLVGDPAGRAAFGDWWDTVGAAGVGVPYLVYLPPTLPPLGRAFVERFAARYGREPTFVAHEAYDTVLVLADALRRPARTRAGIRAALAGAAVDATRGRIAFSTEPAGVVHQQWRWPPVAVAAAPSAGATPSQVETLYRP